MTAAISPTTEQVNLKLLGHDDLGGQGNVGEGLWMQALPGGRRVLWVAHVGMSHDLEIPVGFSALEVTDPKNPRVLSQTKLPHNQVRSNSLCLVNNEVLLVTRETDALGQQPAGLGIYDVSRPEDPKLIAEWDASGPGSKGAHMVWCVDGRSAHLSTGTPDFVAHSPRDCQPYVVLDIANPARPQEAARWWLPGTRVGDDAPPPPRHPAVDRGYRLHNVHTYPQKPNRAYLAFIDGGVIILDTTDLSNMKVVSRWDYHPPFQGMTHTAMPLPSRDLLVVAEERVRLGCNDEQAMYIWMVDIREETNPVPISTCPLPPPALYADRPGWYGPHNIYENLPDTPLAWWNERYVVAAMFNAGVRVYDIANPFRPEEVACYLPELPPGQSDIRMNDVYVDERGIVYAGDRTSGGIYILECSLW